MFQPAPHDWTVQLFTKLFGPGWQTLYLHANGGSAKHNVLVAMMGDFNNVVFMVMAAFWAYTTIIAGYSTAHEGEALGKKYHWAYAPVRGVLGFGLLAPLGPKGLCLLQALVLMFIGSGIGLADHLWNVSIDWLESHGGSITTMTTRDPTDMEEKILKILVTREYLVEKEHQTAPKAKVKKVPEPPAMYFTTTGMYVPAAGIGAAQRAQRPPPPDKYMMTFPIRSEGGIFSSAQTTALGHVKYTCPGAVKPSGKGPLLVDTAQAGARGYCDAKDRAIMAVVDKMQVLAEQIVQDKGKPDQKLLRQAAEKYNSIIGKAINTYSGSFNQRLKNAYKTFATVAKDEGWASAGSWYLQIARVNADVNAGIGDMPSVSPPDQDSLNTYSDIKPYLRKVDTMISVYEGAGGAIPDSVANSDKAKARQHAGIIEKAMTAVGDGLKTRIVHLETNGLKHISSGQDPIIAMQAIGQSFADSASSGLIGAVLFGAATGYFLGPYPAQVIGGVIKLLFIPGIILGWIVPLTPFILFTMAVIRWVILAVESWIAAPFWAMAHGMPEGEGFVGQHTRQGYMLFFSMLVKPSLIVMGYMASLVLLSVIMPFVAKGFAQLIEAQAAATGWFTTVISAFVFMSVFGVFAVAVIKICFSLITTVADNILKWVGNNVSQLGAEQHAQGVMGAAPAATAGAIGVAGALPQGRWDKGVKEKGEQQAFERAQKRKQEQLAREKAQDDAGNAEREPNEPDEPENDQQQPEDGEGENTNPREDNGEGENSEENSEGAGDADKPPPVTRSGSPDGDVPTEVLDKLENEAPPPADSTDGGEYAADEPGSGGTAETQPPTDSTGGNNKLDEPGGDEAGNAPPPPSVDG
jgi:conjugal transfer/type IV secretion protein DotA/TraY